MYNGLTEGKILTVNSQTDNSRHMINVIKQTKQLAIGHLLRRESLLLDIIESRMTGKLTRERKSLQVISHMMKGKSFDELKQS